MFDFVSVSNKAFSFLFLGVKKINETTRQGEKEQDINNNMVTFLALSQNGNENKEDEREIPF